MSTKKNLSRTQRKVSLERYTIDIELVRYVEDEKEEQTIVNVLKDGLIDVSHGPFDGHLSVTEALSLIAVINRLTPST